MPDSPRAQRGVIDTSVVIDLEQLEAGQLPVELAVSAITMAELAAGPHATGDADERARRQDRLQRAEAAFDPLPFDGEAARAYGRIYAAEAASGRKARGTRASDLLIAATACGAGLPIYTRNPGDFQSLGGSSKSSRSERTPGDQEVRARAICGGGGSRTLTGDVLSVLPLPFGLHPRVNAAPAHRWDPFCLVVIVAR